jgi:hypothetical protein
MTSSGTAEQGNREGFSPPPRISFAISTKIFNNDFDFKKLPQD